MERYYDKKLEATAAANQQGSSTLPADTESAASSAVAGLRMLTGPKAGSCAHGPSQAVTAPPGTSSSPTLTECGSVLLGLRRGVQRQPPRNQPERHSSPDETGHCATRASGTWWCRSRPPETWPKAEEAKQAASSVGVHRCCSTSYE